MIRTISAETAQDTFNELLTSVRQSDEPIIVEQDGQPVAVVISPEAYQRFQYLQSQAEQIWVTVDEVRARHGGKNLDELFNDVTSAMEQLQQGRAAHRDRTNPGSR